MQVKVLLLDTTAAALGIVNAPLEDVVGRARRCRRLGNRRIRVRRPIDNRDDVMGGRGGDRGLVPVILHLNLELSEKLACGPKIADRA